SSHDKDADEVPDKEDKGVCKGSGIDDQDLTDSSTQDVNTAELSINTVTTIINTDLPNDKRAIRTKWIFRNKKDERGIVVRNKARLVAQGFLTYQMDVKSAFLYGTIEEEVYVCQPSRFKDAHFLNKVYKVEKALYRSIKKSLYDVSE
nr:hypothetical protein [Tanacetum cinerariifolium]